MLAHNIFTHTFIFVLGHQFVEEFLQRATVDWLLTLECEPKNRLNECQQIHGYIMR